MNTLSGQSFDPLIFDVTEQYEMANVPPPRQRSDKVRYGWVALNLVSFVLLVMLLGYLLRAPFVIAEELFPTGSFFERANLLSVLPLFLFCLLAGLGMQKVVDAYCTDQATGRSFIDRPTMERISNSAQAQSQTQRQRSCCHSVAAAAAAAIIATRPPPLLVSAVGRGKHALPARFSHLLLFVLLPFYYPCECVTA